MSHPQHFPIGIGELSRRTGCRIETIRYYERQGLMPPPPRTDGGHRLYSEALAGRLEFIRRSRELGFPMERVRDLLTLVDGEQVSCEAVKALAEEQLDDINTRIRDLRKMQRSLTELAGRCSDNDAPECPIIDDLQRSG